MKCPRCQSDNPAGTHLCTSCGAELFTGAETQRTTGGPQPGIPPQGQARSESASMGADNATREMLRKRAFTGSAEITGASPYITQPSVGTQRIGQVEREMSLTMGVLFVVGVGVAAAVIYLNLPEEDRSYAGSPMAFLVEHALRKQSATPANFETYIGYEIGSPMMYDAKAALGLREVEKVTMEVPSGAGKLVIPEQPQAMKTKAKPVEPVVESPAPVAEAEVESVPVTPPSPVEVAALAPVEKAALPPPKTEPADGAPVVDRSINSEKPHKQTRSGCAAENDSKDCAHRHVVTFRRNWGPVLEERVYPSREMSMRARQLWFREGKILEPDGVINETYVVKPGGFSPIPGHPA
jgi:hypothetical protein